ncbi:hypothetical protein VTK26DRAFT_6309 [Humicola hyalothermophila]
MHVTSQSDISPVSWDLRRRRLGKAPYFMPQHIDEVMVGDRQYSNIQSLRALPTTHYLPRRRAINFPNRQHHRSVESSFVDLPLITCTPYRQLPPQPLHFRYCSLLPRTPTWDSLLSSRSPKQAPSTE